MTVAAAGTGWRGHAARLAALAIYIAVALAGAAHVHDPAEAATDTCAVCRVVHAPLLLAPPPALPLPVVATAPAPVPPRAACHTPRPCPLARGPPARA